MSRRPSRMNSLPRNFGCLAGASLLATLGMHAPAVAAPATLDPQIQAITEQARSAFLATQPFKRLNLAVWVQAAPGNRGAAAKWTLQHRSTRPAW